MYICALTPLRGFQELDKFWDLRNEYQVHARLHAASIRPGGVAQRLAIGVCEYIYEFAQAFASRIDE